VAGLRLRLGLAALFAVLFAIVYGGASALSGLRDPPPAPHFSFEMAIPFVPEMAWIYLSLPVALVLAPFVPRRPREVVPLFLTLTAQLLIAGLCFLIQPFSLVWPAREAEAGIFRFMDVVNLDFKEIPSLHVAFATTLVLVFGRRFPTMRVLLGLWLVAVALSTLLTHEHQVLDVVTGAALGTLAVAMVQRRTEREDFLEALRVEVLCLRELARFTRRHPRYLLTGLVIWGYSLPRWRATRLLRTGFCLAQHIDDVLDGDRPVSGDPVAYARGLLRGAPGQPLAPLAASVLAELDIRGGRETLAELVEVLIEDRRRMDARRTMPAAALAAHHRKTFRLSLDLTLIAAGSRLRSGDAPELVEALAWCSPVRDLEEDLAKGLINIPEEVLARVTPGSLILAAEPVQEWLRAEHQKAAEALASPPGPRSSPDPGVSVLAALHRALSSYERKYWRRFFKLAKPRADVTACRSIAP
jgi:membrane-associated phospholipid phosphatase